MCKCLICNVEMNDHKSATELCEEVHWLRQYMMEWASDVRLLSLKCKVDDVLGEELQFLHERAKSVIKYTTTENTNGSR